MFAEIGVIGTINSLRELPSFKIIDGLNEKNGRNFLKHAPHDCWPTVVRSALCRHIC